MSYSIENEITSINGYIDYIKELKTIWKARNANDIWFRGESQDYVLLPKVFRNKIIGSTAFTYNEFYIYQAFTSLYKNYIDANFQHKYEILTFMQHYGVPTRLLDWTESALVALFFAVEKWGKDSDAFIWVMEMSYLNNLSNPKPGKGPFLGDIDITNSRFELIGNIENGFVSRTYYDSFPNYRGIKLEYPIAFYPKAISNKRLANQKGTFVIYGKEIKPLENIFIDNGQTAYLKKVRIPRDKKKIIYDELRLLGITERSIYPDIEGLAKEMNSSEFLQ
jgi:hypothetical protein